MLDEQVSPLANNIGAQISAAIATLHAERVPGRTVGAALKFLRRRPRWIYLAVRGAEPAYLRISLKACREMLTDKQTPRGAALPSTFYPARRHLFLGGAPAER